MFIKNFILDFIKENMITFITYILIIVFFFPIEGVVLPNVYGKLFELFKKNVKVENFGNVFTNIKKQNIQGAITLLIFVWMLVVGSGFLKHEVESTLIPEYMKYTRNLISYSQELLLYNILFVVTYLEELKIYHIFDFENISFQKYKIVLGHLRLTYLLVKFH